MAETRLVAIHQPNFLPWLGFFDKLTRCDAFVLLDHVQFPRTGRGTWTNRVQLLVSGKPAWLTVPIVRPHPGTQPIGQIRISEDTAWREKLLATMRHNYVRAPFFREVLPVVERILDYRSEWLAEYNTRGIRELVRAMGLTHGEVLRSSELDAPGHGTDLLISITKAARGSAYLCGGGASAYQEDEKFAVAGIELVYQDFKHPTYPQANTQQFVPGLSTVDALMNCGFEATRALLRREAGPLEHR